VHLVDPSCETELGSHLRQAKELLAAATFEKVALGHSMHALGEDEPKLGLKVPGMHAMQEPLPVLLLLVLLL